MYKGLIKSGLLVSLFCFATVCFAETKAISETDAKNDSTEYTYPHISNGIVDDKIIDLADSLLASSRIAQEDMGNIAITSFVNLHDLSQTSSFGRTLAETFFNELFIRGFNIIDIRSKGTLSINPTGEYFITRDEKKIDQKIENAYVLLGTFSTIEKKVVINARILDYQTGRVVAAAKTYYKTSDCHLLGTCPKVRNIQIVSKDAISNSHKQYQSTKKVTTKQISIF